MDAASERTPWRQLCRPPRADYQTFSRSMPGRNVGLTMQTARRRLLASIEQQIAEKERSTMFTTEFRDPFTLLLVLCAVFRFVDAVRQSLTVPVFEAAFLLGAAVLNVLLNRMQRRRHHDEMAERVRVAVDRMLRDADEAANDMDLSNPFYPRASVTSTKPTVLLPSTCYVACYRDNQWQRLPMNLLVERDLIALMSGDIAPGDVRLVTSELVAEAESEVPTHRPQQQQNVYPRGSAIPSFHGSEPRDMARCNATFNPALVLELCGEMRLFEMMETPVVRDIEDALFRINRPETGTQKLQAKARLIAVYVCTLYSVLVLVAIGLRVVLQHRSLYTTLNHILLGPIGVWLCFASLNTPFVLFVAEAAATSSILGSFENNVLVKNAESSGSEKTSSDTKNYPMDHPLAGESATPASTNDIYDFEDREQIRSEKAAKQSAVRRSLQYFMTVLKFRAMSCVQAHSSHGTQLPVPFRSFRLLERLGSTTMLCCFDDDILCEPTPSVEEIFLLNEKEGSSTVLDLHPERHCETGLKFEDPKWKQHLPSLKPLGLAILLNDTDDAANQYQTTMRYLVNESIAAAASPAGGPEEIIGLSKDPCLRSCLQRLSAHVRMLPFPKHLVNLSREMGFAPDDLSVFQRQQSLHIIGPRLAHHEHTIDHHDQGQEDTRYRGNLKTHLYSTVVLDKRSHRHQLLSRGHPTIALTQCSEYWDGKSICPLTSEKRRLILDMYNQWRVEDLECVALSYVPVPHKLNSLFTRPSEPTNSFSVPSTSVDMLPPVYLVEENIAGDVPTQDMASPLPRATGTYSVSTQQSIEPKRTRERGRSQVEASPATSPNSVDGARASGEMFAGQHSFSNSTVLRPVSPSSKIRGGSAIHTFSDVASSVGMHPSDAGPMEKDTLLWRIQEDQIFLGMVATGVQPKRSIPDFIEDVTASGIRFVYFSPRNMRRSKLLAEKMGIETDWNCAISLRSLETDDPDPHRMTSNYSDWDVKARLPHGVEAIKRHLDEVDNVPLLVSLYTDSTPETISEMISVFQENNEVVMGVGSSMKESNAPLFSKSDTAIALQSDLHCFFDQKLPQGSDISCFTEQDAELSHILNTLACSFRIRFPSNEASTTAQSAGSSEEHFDADRATSLTHLMELIRLGRAMLTNFHAMMTFIFVSQLFLATLILTSYVVPFPLVPQLSCASIFWLLWVLVPVVSMTMLATAAEADIMKKTPRKNEEIELNEDLPRLSIYFLIRHVPSCLVSIAVFECLLGFSLEEYRANLGSGYETFRWIDFVLHSSLVLVHPRPPIVNAAINRAEGGMLLMIGICILASSCGYLHRSESIFSRASPFRNIIWMTVCAILLVIQVLISALKAGLFSNDQYSLWPYVKEAVPWYFWLLFLIWPLCVIVIDEIVKSHDRHHLTRYYKFLRMQFDTRLGMWSPK